MLTRHWYPRDAVGDALLAAASVTQWRDPLRKQKLVFWTYELVLSEEWEYLWGILETVATRWGNRACIEAVRHDVRDPTAILHFLQILLTLPTPLPLDPPKTRGNEPVLVNVPAKPVAWTEGQRVRLLLAVRDAEAHRRPARLLALLAGLKPAVAAAYLGVQSTQSTNGIYHLLEVVGCPVPPTSSAAHLALKWPELAVGRIAARLFALPRSLVASIESLDPLSIREGGAFWRRVWREEVLASADREVAEETFWNTYFADDMPDEWSAAERAKSHGLVS